MVSIATILPRAEGQRCAQLGNRRAGGLDRRPLVAAEIIWRGLEIADRVFEVLNGPYDSRMGRGFASHGLRVCSRHGGGNQKSGGQG